VEAYEYLEIISELIKNPFFPFIHATRSGKFTAIPVPFSISSISLLYLVYLKTKLLPIVHPGKTQIKRHF